jgi:hypothetical protein
MEGSTAKHHKQRKIMNIVLKPNQRTGRTQADLSSYRCSRKQKQLLLRYLNKCHLDQSVIERIAQERFGKPLQTLNRSEARKLILLLHE